MDGSSVSRNFSTYYSDEESQNSTCVAYNPSAIGSNAADESNEYIVDPLLSPNTPAYHPTLSALARSDEDSESLSSIEENKTRNKRISPDIQRDIEEELDSLLTGPVPKRGRPSSIVGENEESDKTIIESAAKADENDLNTFSGGPDDEKDDDQGGDFGGFDGDGTGTRDMIADIFGESDAEGDGDFEGFAENEVEKEVESSLVVDTREVSAQHRHHQREHQSQLHEDEDEVDDETFVSDFEKVARKMRDDRRRRRRLGKDVEFLNDTDAVVQDTIRRMRDAAEQDRRLLSKNRPATKKLRMLKDVDNLFIRTDFSSTLIDNGILPVIAEWLSPVVDHTLPSISIRECLLKHLKEFDIRDTDLLKESGLGKAVMFIYKHPKETSANKKRAYSLITAWSRPIFNLPIDYSSLSKEERKQMDYEHLMKHKRDSGAKKHKRDELEANVPLRPGDPGFVSRARVPQPSNRDYVVRPKWNVPEATSAFEEGDEDGSSSISRKRRVQQSSFSSGISSTSRIEKQIRALSRAAAAHKRKRFSSAAKMSIEGRNLSL